MDRSKEKNPKAKLTSRRVQILREYYAINKRPKGAPKHSSFITAKEIARRLRMSISTIRPMLRGESWVET